ncbi:hypothetical protein [Corynebacterium variabile]|uniref:hypothetical protein n=1 Tax=Corynebacterium variabile TaxID=1727 RepID=UPI003FD10CED
MDSGDDQAIGTEIEIVDPIICDDDDVLDGEPIDAEPVDSDDPDAKGTVGGSVRSGSQLTALVALRDKLADAIDQEMDSRAIATLTRQLTDVLQRIDDLGGVDRAAGMTPVDELSKRRRARARGA